MATLGQILSRTFFWSYERGTWQYDVAVVVILIFALLTPRSWFHDQPASGAPRARRGKFCWWPQEKATGRPIAWIRGCWLHPRNSALQNDLHNALKEALPELHKGNFSISKIEPVRDEQGTVIAYQVEIKR